MAAGQYYDPRKVPQSNEGSGWTLESDPERDRVHHWVRMIGEVYVIVTRRAADWWEIEMLDEGEELVHEAVASSRVAAFAKVNLWAWSRMEVKV